jgi:hypothetical protein
MYGDALTTKALVKDRLQITATTFDDVIDNMILAVTARIEQMTGRRYIQGTFTNELHDGSDVYGHPRIYLIVKNAPLQSVTSIEYKAGTNATPSWTEFDEEDYSVDLQAGIIEFPDGLPRGRQNIRITYTGGYSGTSYAVENYWVFNETPTGTVDGSNLAFTLAADAEQVVVYADGIRESAANVTHVAGTDEFTMAAGRAPFTTIAADYLRTDAGGDDVSSFLPADLVDVCERAVTTLFKRRDSEGRKNETFQESTITWRDSMFSEEDRVTIKNYRRGYNL